MHWLAVILLLISSEKAIAMASQPQTSEYTTSSVKVNPAFSEEPLAPSSYRYSRHFADTYNLPIASELLNRKGLHYIGINVARGKLSDMPGFPHEPVCLVEILADIPPSTIRLLPVMFGDEKAKPRLERTFNEPTPLSQLAQLNTSASVELTSSIKIGDKGGLVNPSTRIAPGPMLGSTRISIIAPCDLFGRLLKFSFTKPESFFIRVPLHNGSSVEYAIPRTIILDMFRKQ